MFAYTIKFLIIPILVFIAFFISQKFIGYRWLKRLSTWLNSRGLFYSSRIESDQMVLNLVRIALGSILLYRLFWIGKFLFPLSPEPTLVIAFWIYFILAVFLTIGLFTPITALLLLFYQLYFNFSLGTYTLGVDVTAMLLLCFVLYPAGQLFSIDSWITRRFIRFGQFYMLFLNTDRNMQITLAKAVSFYSYCLLCLYSVLAHLNEPLWLNGEAAIHLLSSTYLSRYPNFFQNLFSSSAIAVLLAKISMLIMVLWYFLLGPAVIIGGIFRKLVIGWGICFYFLSLFVLQLSVLPIIEFLILFVWFSNRIPNQEVGKLNILYDDYCNLCDRTMRFLRTVDIAGIINYQPLSKNLDKAIIIGVNESSVYKDLYGWENNSNKVYIGYSLYCFLAKRLLLLLPLWPILYLGKLLLIGPFIYRFIADRRIRLFGVCKVPTDTTLQVGSPLIKIKNLRSVNYFKPILLTALLFSLVLVVILPVSPFKNTITTNYSYLVRSAHILSWTRIDVFNRADLGMTHHYYTLERLSANDDNYELIPVTQFDGSRLDWHRSDRVYFGNTLPWRRLKNSESVLPVTERDKLSYCEVITWANNDKHQKSKSSIYRISIFESEWPKYQAGLYAFSEPNIVASVTLTTKDCE